MTTITVLSTFLTCLLGYAAIELVMWFLEAMFATIKYIVCYFINRPCSWKTSYLGIRIIFTWLLKWVSFAELSPTQMYKHRRGIESYVRGLADKHHRRKEAVWSRLSEGDKKNG